MIIDALVFRPVLYFKWRDSIKSEADLGSAPICTGPDNEGFHR